ncbi:EamA family transporter [Bacillus siamensis]|uniref:EamA family transporter n=1 Tax=Bacillus siamensis TaxID=659243 RepID=A0AAI8HJX3_9BACI|nr:EamA family transporter [Bacillus sp. SDLI1]AME06816.1 transporter [Bacillus sp. SDLI1]AUJ75395.1 EamA family transporter [Bacillus siamensis]UUA84230.1 EamA family transporter [Bacillus siamensis]
MLTGAILWGVSGTVAQYLFQDRHFNTEWLTSVRLLLSGALLLGIAYRKEKGRIWAVWKDRRDKVPLLLFGIFGMLGVQYTYFAAIEYGNAATATVLQYLGPAIITCFLAIRAKRMPSAKELLAVLLAAAGTFILVTHGNAGSLSISGLAVFWGISSAFALAFYTLQPHRLLKKWGSAIIVGWGMLIGGAALSLVRPPWKFEGQWSLSAYAAIVFIIIFGTLIAFYCYLESLKYLSASETSLFACAEPLSAAFLAVIWLHVPFGLSEWLGTLLILATIALLSIKKK